MKNVLVILFLCVAVSFGQVIWTQRSRVKHHTEFFSQVMQETIYAIERRGFSTLKLSNITKEINQAMYKWHVKGTAVYTNGFLVSIQKIDVTDMQQQVTSPTVNGVPNPSAYVSGKLNLWGVKLGYDVIFTPLDGPVQFSTGEITLTSNIWTIGISKNLTTSEVTVSQLSSGISGGRMVYRPATNITEVISRGFRVSEHSSGVETWAAIIRSKILDVIRTKVPFPEVCFSHC